MGVSLPDLREGKWKIRAEIEKCSISKGFEGGLLSFVLNDKSTPHFIILT